MQSMYDIWPLSHLLGANWVWLLIWVEQGVIAALIGRDKSRFVQQICPTNLDLGYSLPTQAEIFQLESKRKGICGRLG